MAAKKKTKSAAPAPTAARRRALRKLAERIGHTFDDLALLERALCHASTANEGKESYERLEFLGDAILGFVVADVLYRQTPEIPEGQLTDRRAGIVSRPPLAEVARRLDLPAHLEAGRGFRTKDLESPRIHADLTEAVIAAIYLDGGIRAARKFVRNHVIRAQAEARATIAGTNGKLRDPKSRLLHLCQMHQLGQPSYRVVKTHGPDHERVFVVDVLVAGEAEGRGKDRSKQGAEMLAAEKALKRLQKRIASSGNA